ncbi:MAG: hypothetical protein IRZ06_10135 [Nevskia sp.]|nr:hypothetical protein [Nevskia sp.]
MTTTFDDLIADVESELYNFTQGNDAASWLTAAVQAADTAIPVADTSVFSVGFAEIVSPAGAELVWVAGVDANTQTLTVAPWGRGQRGTKAAAHPSGAKIVPNPQFPRSRVMRAINDAISDSYPTVFRLAFVDEPYEPGRLSYSLPEEADGLIDVLARSDVGVGDSWQPFHRLRFNPTSHTVELSPTATLNWGLDWTLRFVYRAAPLPMVELGDTLDDVGFGDDCRSLIRTFATYKLLSSLQGQRLQLSAVESAVMAQLRQPDYLNNSIKTMFAQVQLLLQQNGERLRAKYPPLRWRYP